MALWHGYLATQRVDLTEDQAQQIWQQLRTLGPAGNPRHPAQRCHWRLSLDKTLVIFEAAFDTDTLTIDAIKNRLANIFNVDPDLITHATTQHTYDTIPTTIVTFRYTGADRFRLAALGGLGATWPQSGREAIALIASDPTAWETPEE